MLENNIRVKTCSSCGLTKPITEFSPHSEYKSKQHYCSRCKPCDCERSKKYYHSNAEKIKPKNRENARKYYEKNKEKCLQSIKNYRNSLTPQEKEELSEKKKAWRQTNAEKLKQRRTELRKTPAGRIVRNIRKRLQKKMRGIKKTVSLSKSIGKKSEALKEYLESKFLPGMTWENYGIDGWHIDHIKPLSAFDFTDPAQQAAANHYTNLQPLWAEDNLAKGDYYQP